MNEQEFSKINAQFLYRRYAIRFSRRYLAFPADEVWQVLLSQALI